MCFNVTVSGSGDITFPWIVVVCTSLTHARTRVDTVHLFKSYYFNITFHEQNPRRLWSSLQRYKHNPVSVVAATPTQSKTSSDSGGGGFFSSMIGGSEPKKKSEPEAEAPIGAAILCHMYF